MTDNDAGEGKNGGFDKMKSAATAQDGAALTEDDDLPEVDAAQASGGQGTARNESSKAAVMGRRTIAIIALGRAAAAAGHPDLFESRSQVVVVVRVPTVSWVTALSSQLAKDHPNWKLIERPTRYKSDNHPDFESDVVADRIVTGRTVIGLAVDPEATLPRNLVAGADVTMTIPAPDSALVEAVLAARFPDAAPPSIPETAVIGLDIDDLASAMRQGADGAETVRLLTRASQRRSSAQRALPAPDLFTASEYGAGQEVGLALVQDIKDFRKGLLSWNDMMKGACFFGVSGGGKSTLADSIAQAAGVPIVKFSVGQLFGANSHLGTVIQAQRDVFASAKALASPCSILFLDEIEALPRRDCLDARGRDWWLPIINDFLLMADAANPIRRGVVILGATNLIELVEPAFLRPGRLERAIEIGRPDHRGTINVLRFHLKNDLDDIDIGDVARLAEGSTSAELADMVRAARRAARREQRPLAPEDLMAAVLGENDASPDELRRYAIHEAGHAVAAVTSGAGTLIYVALRSVGLSAGQTRIEPRDDDLPTLDIVEQDIVVLLAGTAAEEALCGSASIGSGGSDSSDLARATASLAAIYASTSLMGELFHLADGRDAVRAIRAEPRLRAIIEIHLRKLHERAAELVARHRDRISAVAAALAERRHLGADAVVGIISRIPQNDELPAAPQVDAPLTATPPRSGGEPGPARREP